MKILAVYDENDYDNTIKSIETCSVRAIIIKNGKIVMQMEGTGQYKIPGGGIEEGEDIIDALKREVREETGYTIIDDSIVELGEIHEIRKDLFDSKCKFMRKTYFYYCKVENHREPLKLTEHEIKMKFTCVCVKPETIISVNEAFIKKGYWNVRDTEFIRMINEGLIKEIDEKEFEVNE